MTWLDWFPEETLRRFDWLPPYTHHIYRGDLDAEFIFLDLDTAEDVKKLLSLELNGAWINEAREVPRAIIEACTMRVDRRNPKTGLQPSLRVIALSGKTM
jgi:hypothetical protein